MEETVVRVYKVKKMREVGEITKVKVDIDIELDGNL